MSSTPSQNKPPAGELRQRLEQAGLRLTRQRAAVYDYLQTAAGHPTAEEIFAAVRRQVPALSLATVYKALEALVGAGLARKIYWGDGPCRYDCRLEPHYHFRCLDSQQVLDLPVPFDPELLRKLDPALEESLRKQGFHVTGYRLELQGYYKG
jgi:Fur family transcriptional regulator, peroxide stress response regulator